MKCCGYCGESRFVVQYDGVLTCANGHIVTLWNWSIIRFFPNVCAVCNCASFRIRDDGVLTCAQGHIVHVWNGLNYVRIII